MRLTAVLSSLLAFGACSKKAVPAPPAPAAEVRAAAVPDASRLEALDPAWNAVPEMVVDMLPQDVTEPKLTTPGVAKLGVRAIVDGERIVFRLEWDDPTDDEASGIGRFSDGAAVQLPVAAGGDVPSVQMGQPGRPVRISMWKAAWQASGADVAAEMAARFPNALVDHYPAEAAADPEVRHEMETRYAPARAAGNPVAVLTPLPGPPSGHGPPLPPAGHAVQDLVAEGFGTLTALPEPVAAGRGVRSGDRWVVTISLPLAAGPEGSLVRGKRTYAAFALWDGAAGNVGARKMRSNWVPLVLAPPAGAP